jgi:hypothetical protein
VASSSDEGRGVGGDKEFRKGGDMAVIAIANIARVVQEFREGKGVVENSD